MNLTGRWQGQGYDYPLNETGRVQARALARGLENSGIEIVYSSPLKRAVETGRAVADLLHVPLTTEDGLKEGRFGAAEGKTKAEIQAAFPDIAPAWQSLEESDMDARFPGGESKRDIQRRVLTAMRKIACESDRTVIGVSAHSAVMRCFMLLFGLKLYTVPHGTPFHLICDDSEFSLPPQ